MAHPPLSDERRSRLLALIGLGASMRQAAEQVGVSHVTAFRVSRGQPANENGPLGLQAGERLSVPPVRCADCGGLLLVLPCRLCRVRANKAATAGRAELGPEQRTMAAGKRPNIFARLNDLAIELRTERLDHQARLKASRRRFHQARRQTKLQREAESSRGAAEPRSGTDD
jgi:hypothetical protein